ncbi:MAG: CIC family chloride channel protein [Flavobacteriales bacterium]
MNLPFKSRSSINTRIDNFRLALAHLDALPQLSVLSLIIGSATALLIVLFRQAIELPFSFSSLSSAESFEEIPTVTRCIIIMTGGLIIALVMQWLPSSQRQMSVGHVIDRTHNHQGSLPFKNWLAQYVLAIICIISGQSVGREGPAVHIGAGCASLFGKWMRLPKNSMQSLIACGVASGIAASFDTPMAGVIFAMEVILLDYSIVGFVPVILSSVVGAAISRAMLGEISHFRIGDSGIGSLSELGFVVVMGFFIAMIAGTYIRLNILTAKLTRYPIFFRVLVAAGLCAAASWFAPEIMGLGYDTIEASLAGEIAILSLIVIAFTKLFVSPIVVGLGIPGGLIGPALFIGACVGAIAGNSANALFPNMDVNPNLYILLGMTGMMAAVVNAPLAALVAVLELSFNSQIIFPAMLMIVIACIVTRTTFKVQGIFVEQLNVSGRQLEMTPAAKALRRAGVTSIMDRQFSHSPTTLQQHEASQLLQTQPNWIVYEDQETIFALAAADLAHKLNEETDNSELDEFNLAEIPGRCFLLGIVNESDSLYDALSLIEKSACDAIAVIRHTSSREKQIRGIITREAINNYYRPKGLNHAMG